MCCILFRRVRRIRILIVDLLLDSYDDIVCQGLVLEYYKTAS